jgi:hypothetical protein
MRRDSGEDLVLLIDQCLADLRLGRATFEQCLERHADVRDELRPLLEIALSIVPPVVVPDPARKAAARRQFVEALRQEQSTEEVPFWGFARIIAKLA